MFSDAQKVQVILFLFLASVAVQGQDQTDAPTPAPTLSTSSCTSDWKETLEKGKCNFNCKKDDHPLLFNGIPTNFATTDWSNGCGEEEEFPLIAFQGYQDFEFIFSGTAERDGSVNEISFFDCTFKDNTIPNLSKIKNLFALNLENTSIVSDLSDLLGKLPDPLDAEFNLQQLNLQNNGEGLKGEWKEFLGFMTKQIPLDLWGNNFEGCIEEQDIEEYVQTKPITLSDGVTVEDIFNMYCGYEFETKVNCCGVAPPTPAPPPVTMPPVTREPTTKTPTESPTKTPTPYPTYPPFTPPNTAAPTAAPVPTLQTLAPTPKKKSASRALHVENIFLILTLIAGLRLQQLL